MEYSEGEDNPLKINCLKKYKKKTLKHCIFRFHSIESRNNTHLQLNQKLLVLLSAPNIVFRLYPKVLVVRSASRSHFHLQVPDLSFHKLLLEHRAAPIAFQRYLKTNKKMIKNNLNMSKPNILLKLTYHVNAKSLLLANKDNRYFTV